MEAIELLKNYKIRLEPRLARYFKQKMERAGKNDPVAKQAVKIIADFTMAAGKRIRPALVYYAYLASGGRDGEEILDASMAIELIHSFLLIHDDVIDRDVKRHGIPTVHTQYAKIGKMMNQKNNSEHFGNSMAIISGDMAAAMGNEIIFNAKFPPEIIIRALDKLQDIVFVTIPGEMLDVILERRGNAIEKEILRMFEGKTSRYTFEGPLHLGAVLAGAGQKTLDIFSAYSLPLGKAFQIRDDILGVFGDEKKLGKPVGSDIIEGKQTLLFIKALEKGTKVQKAKLKIYLGKKDLSYEELMEYRTIVKESGALEYCESLAKKFVAEALDTIKWMEFKNDEAKSFLRGLAEFIIAREV
jgi:geranylgeranyl diphosphate synthase type I